MLTVDNLKRADCGLVEVDGKQFYRVHFQGDKDGMIFDHSIDVDKGLVDKHGPEVRRREELLGLEAIGAPASWADL